MTHRIFHSPTTDEAGVAPPRSAEQAQRPATAPASQPSEGMHALNRSAQTSSANAMSRAVRQRAVEPSVIGHQDDVGQVQESLDAGQPMSGPLQARFEQSFGHDFSDVRVHPDSPQPGGLGSSALTLGSDILFAPGRFRPNEPRGQGLLAHELAHVVQQSNAEPHLQGDNLDSNALESEARLASTAVMRGQPPPTLTSTAGMGLQPGDEEPQETVCAPESLGSFILDPALENPFIPPETTAHLLIREPSLVGEAEPEPVYIVLHQAVCCAEQISVFAIPQELVFSTPEETAAPECAPNVMPPEPYADGDVAYTEYGAIHPLSADSDYVVTTERHPLAVAAATVVLAYTEHGAIVIESGLQHEAQPWEASLPHEALITELLWQLSGRLPENHISQVMIAHTSADAGFLLPRLGAYFTIGRVLALADVSASPDFQEVLEEMQTANVQYRQYLEQSLETQLDSQREHWEAQNPIAPNEDIREQRWQQWRSNQLQALRAGIVPPRTDLLIEGEQGLQPPPMPEPAEAPPAEAPAAIVDMTDVAWEPVDEGVVWIVGNQSLWVIPAREVLQAPILSQRPEAPTVPGLRPAGPRGPTPPSARAASPWLGLPTIGKAALTMVRTSEGIGLLIDIGASSRHLPLDASRLRLMPGNVLSRLGIDMGVDAIEHVAFTHPHPDHLMRNVARAIIREHGIRAERVTVSRAWRGADIIRGLASVGDPVLEGLGFTSEWEPGVEVARTGVARGSIALSSGGQMEFLALGEAQQAFEDAMEETEGRAPRSSHLADRASLIYFHGSPDTPHRTAWLQDVRFRDLQTMYETMGQEAFYEAFENVRMVKGFGHHFGPDAGTTVRDIVGLDTLMRATLMRHGELTIVVQTTEGFAFGSRNPRSLALLEYASGMGARVVLVTEAAAGEPVGRVVIDTQLQVRRSGTGTQVVEGERIARLASRRILELRTALELLRAEPDLTLRVLRLSNHTAASAQSALETEIQRLEGLREELLVLRGERLLEARSSRGAAALPGLRRSRAIAAGDTSGAGPPPRSLEDILSGLGEERGIENDLSLEARRHLRNVARLGGSLQVEAGISAMPREIADFLELPETDPEVQRRIREGYEAMERITARFEGDQVPPEHCVDLLAEATALRAELQQRTLSANEAQRAGLEAEIQRLDTMIETLRSQVVSERSLSRTAEGAVRSTEYVAARPNPRVDAFYEGVGRFLGGVMVFHSVQGLAHTAAQMDEMPIPQSALRIAQNAYGLTIGVRMIRLSRVHFAEFVAIAVLDFSAAAAGEYETSEERDIALWSSGINNAVGLLCFAAGSKVMTLGAGLVHPVAQALVMGLGLGIIVGGPFILRLIGLDDYLVDWLSFPPTEVTRAYRHLNELLTEYRTTVGALQLSAREPAQLRALGAEDPGVVVTAAGAAVEAHRERAVELENEIVVHLDRAYERAATSFAGLRELDSMTRQFADLRFMAQQGGAYGAGSDQRRRIEERVQAFERHLDLSSESEATIRGLEQWESIDAKFDECHREIYKPQEQIDHDALLESFRELETMMQNARYRLNPEAQGAFRRTPLIAPGTPARRAYEQELTLREQRLARYVERMAEVGAGRAEPLSREARRRKDQMFLEAANRARGSQIEHMPWLFRHILRTVEEEEYGMPDTQLVAALQRMLEVRAQYDDLVEQGREAMPELDDAETWNSPRRFEERLTAAHTRHGALLRRIEATETALRSAVSHVQARSVAQGAAARPEIITQMRSEVAAANLAMMERKITCGLIFPSELEAMVEERQRSAHPELAALLGAPAGITDLSPEEQLALESEALAGPGRQMSSVEAQLDLLIEERSEFERELLWGEVESTLNTVYRLRNPFWQDGRAEVSYPEGRDPIVARTGNQRTYPGPPMVGMAITLADVIPLNPDAVQILGGRQLARVKPRDLIAVSIETLRRQARQP